ncbi:MAG: peptide deformylase, partial [Actinomycetota bacterium]
RGSEARVIQHEIDHLDGILILDRVASPAEIFPRRRS